MAALENALNIVSGIVWGPPLLILLFGTHIYLTFRLRLIQRFMGQAIKLSFKRDGQKNDSGKGKSTGDISHFAALMTALAATIGTGNIVGVATAVGIKFA